ncbi:MAG: putative caspase-like protein [Planctomycetaceae bacterium]|jgi:uncharacterized caspase-like protein
MSALRAFLFTTLMVIVLAAGAAEKRVALVIGNSDYAVSPLKNPRNDAEDMAAILRKTGFDVTHLQNLDRRGMARSISQFARDLEQSDATGLFYYAGHGAESAGKSYLFRLGMEVENASELEFEGIDVQRLLRQMQVARNGLNIVIIDACRNNPYRSLRGNSGERGLKRINAPLGSYIASSTASGAAAEDGANDRNSPYTKQLLKHLNTPGLGLEQVFKRVRVGVLEATNGVQIPWETSSLTKEFYFNGSQSVATEVRIVPTKPIAVAIDSGHRDLLDECAVHLRANRLMSGAGGNALACYTEVLTQKRGDPEALAGLQK